MTRGSRALADQRGYTLAELLTAMAVLGLLMAGLFLTLQEGQTVYSFGAGRAEVQQNARVGLERMLRELRTATKLTAANASSVTFEFLDAQGAVRVTQSIEIPPLPPQGTHPLEVHVPGTDLVAWRYRPS